MIHRCKDLITKITNIGIFSPTYFRKYTIKTFEKIKNMLILQEKYSGSEVPTMDFTWAGRERLLGFLDYLFYQLQTGYDLDIISSESRVLHYQSK